MPLKRDTSYPLEIEVEGLSVTLSHMGSRDARALMLFSDELSEHDLLFLRRDIRRLEVIEDWLMEIDSGEMMTILARIGEQIVGYGTLQRSHLSWSRHVAEIRVVTAERVRGKGLGRILVVEAIKMAVRSGIEKLMARMTVDQEGAINMFEGLGFEREALLRDHVKDLEGQGHDLILMSCRTENLVPLCAPPDESGAPC